MNFALVKGQLRRAKVKHIGFAVGDPFGHFNKIINNRVGEFIHG
jgi:hypothetical protein